MNNYLKLRCHIWSMDKIRVFFIGASCTIFALFTYYNYKKLFRGDKKPDADDSTKLQVVRVSQS